MILDADDDAVVTRRAKRPRDDAGVFFGASDAFASAALDPVLTRLRASACRVEDGPMRSASIALLDETSDDADGVYDAIRGAFAAARGTTPTTTRAQLCVYGTDDHFSTWHRDEVGDELYKADALVIFLSDPRDYGGGEFDVGDASVPDRPPRGSFCVFDARRQLHRVRRVTRGERRTLVCWSTDGSAAREPLVAPRPPSTAPPAAVKVVVWDLGDTLWRGTLGDDGGDDGRGAAPNPGIGALSPAAAEAVLATAARWGKADAARARLAQYKVLERKAEARRDRGGDDDAAFLTSCRIRARVVAVAHDDVDGDRITELLQRANRLNFTKRRVAANWYVADEAVGAYDAHKSSATEKRCWKVSCDDAFGDYGVVGVVAADRPKDGKAWRLAHFTFSCRAAGMRVESAVACWLFETLGTVDDGGVLDDIRAVDASCVDLSARSGVLPEPVPKTKRALLRGWCATLQLAPWLERRGYEVACEPKTYAAVRFSSLRWLRAATDDGAVAALSDAALAEEAAARRLDGDDGDGGGGDTAGLRRLRGYDVVVQDLEVDSIWPVSRYRGSGRRAFPLDLAHRDAACAPGLAEDWALLWRRANECPRDARAEGLAEFLSAKDVVADARWLRAALPRETTLVLLTTPDAWDPLYASSHWAAVLDKIPVDVRAGLSARLRDVADALREAFADAPGVVLVDRTAHLGPGAVQEHTHVNREAQVATALAVIGGLEGGDAMTGALEGEEDPS
ncbi:hypothetical protein JL720_12730 [Aureococcus anophagefferens]|nr:hypothetical protein JL720_12730 [Aureococcus anophagefferens]